MPIIRVRRATEMKKQIVKSGDCDDYDSEYDSMHEDIVENWREIFNDR